jgi:hypothetical protein
VVRRSSLVARRSECLIAAVRTSSDGLRTTVAAWARCVSGGGLRGVLMVRGVVLSGRWFRGGRFCVGWRLRL